MPILQEPLVWFVAFALVSLAVTFVLFKFLSSSAQIKRKDYLFKGAIAGFLAVFFMGWYTFYPRLKVPVGEIAPNTIPSGFRAYSDKTLGIAVPKEYEPSVTQELRLDSTGDHLFRITVVENIPLQRFAALKPEDFFNEESRQMLNLAIPMMKILGPGQPAPIQGRNGYAWPIEMTVPDDPMFGEERGTSVKGFYHVILDDTTRNVFILAYDDDEISRKILSTLVLANK